MEDDGLSRLGASPPLKSRSRTVKFGNSGKMIETTSNKRDKGSRRPMDATEAKGTHKTSSADNGNDELKALRANNGSKASVLTKSSVTKSTKSKGK